MSSPVAHEPAPTPCGWSPETLRGFRSGDGPTLRAIYREHAEDIANMLRRGFSFSSSGQAHRFVGYASAFELQDALQETFRRAFEPRARASFDGIRPYGPYLRTIARNVVLRTFRRQRETFPVVDEFTDDPHGVVLHDPEQVNPDTAIEREQLEEIVRSFTEQLGESDRALLNLRFVEGLSQRDAASELGLGRQQVRSREAKLRAALLAHLRRRDAGQFLSGVFLAGAVVGFPILQLITGATP